MSGARVLITGRNGFTGIYLAQDLHAAGYEVFGTGLSPTLRKGPGGYRPCDLRDPEAVDALVAELQPDIVMHLAGMAFVAHGNVEEIYAVNLVATRHLLDALIRNTCGQGGVLLTSSANVYGNAADIPIAEDTPLAPTNDYGVSKLAVEHLARICQGALPIVVARPFNYTGRGQDLKFLVPKIVDHFQRRTPEIELGNTDVARDFSDVRDVVRIYRALIEAQAWGQTVNICSGGATSLEELLVLCQDITGHSMTARVNPDFVRKGEIKVLMGDAQRLHSLTGAMPRTPLNETLAWMLGEG